MQRRDDPSERTASGDDPDHLRQAAGHAELPETSFSRSIDGMAKRIGSLASWFWILLMAVICLNVFMKNVLGQGSIRFEEIQWHIYAALFLLGLSYAMAHDGHVRVDVLHENFSLRTKAWIELAGAVLLLIPFLLLLLYFAVPFVLKAFTDGERSNSPAGLSHYWIIKSFLLLGPGLLLLTVLARMHRCIACLFRAGAPATRMKD